MTTEVHYEVRNGSEVLCDRDHLGPRFLPCTAALMYGHKFTRVVAEGLAAEHGGTVHRVTVTTEPVGLRWEEVDEMPRLWDGEKAIFVVVKWSGYEFKFGLWQQGWSKPYSTLDEAKAAAEAAVKASCRRRTPCPDERRHSSRTGHRVLRGVLRTRAPGHCTKGLRHLVDLWDDRAITVEANTGRVLTVGPDGTL